MFSKFLHKVPKESSSTQVAVLPKLEDLSSFASVKQRTLTGWIAYQMARYLDLSEKQTDFLFLKPFTHTGIQIESDQESNTILQLSQTAFGWLQRNSCVEEEIKQLNLSPSYSTVLSRVVREVQTEEFIQEKTESETKAIWNVYRDVIYAASQGHFLLIEKPEVAKYKSGNLLCEADIQERGDIPIARNAASEVFEKIKLTPSKMMSYKLIVSEAVTNVLKHAEFGRLLIYQDEKTKAIRVIIEDTGKGFPLKILPQTTLMAGFSTKKSLGQGFNLMLKMANQIVLETSSSGSTLILILEGEIEDEEDKLES